MEATLGKRITANRKRLGLTQDQLAEKLGITAQAVSKWENDLSCPDISILPKLADIFCVTTDELLGRESPVQAKESDACTSMADNESGFKYDSDTGKMDFHWEGAKLDRIVFAIWILLTGTLYLIVLIQSLNISFWSLCWPSFLMVFGMFGLYPKFSVFRLSCGLVGIYFLMEKFQILTVTLNTSILIAVMILLFGISQLIGALRKSRRHTSSKHFTNNHRKMTRDYSIDGDSFTYDISFGSSTQLIQMERLRSGHISVNFGEYVVDLRNVVTFESDCTLNADCSFGVLTIQMPRKYMVVPDSSTSFASFEVKGHPDAVPLGIVHLQADVSFGEICVEYL